MDQKTLLNKITNRKISIIGIEGYGLEAAVYSVLRTLPNFVLLENKSHNELQAYVDSDSFRRDLKLRGLLNGGKINLVVDMSTISSPYSGEPMFISQNRLFTELREKVIQNDYNIYTGANSIEINLIFVMMMNNNLKLNGKKPVVETVANTGLQICDICIIFKKDTIHIIKDREGESGVIKFNPKFLRREMILKGLLK
jgi:hypothetical protein